ncbi:hypothetical protein [Nocardia iowensis]|uniref:Uncharacterized protein n=1 Tax=Nocardia iowensis TaxID=204891 RepID=A0ABX8RSG9_NOCIO|nr:hypothetical protein [Nocardia iowensis]QXN92587.1 hypothetical protein KV110_05440 [Nocardia iowensis]
MLDLLRHDSLVVVNNLPWVQAFLEVTAGTVLLFVHRSLALPLDDENYDPVADFIKVRRTKLLSERTERLPQFMFGQALMSCYRIDGVKESAA